MSIRTDRKRIAGGTFEKTRVQSVLLTTTPDQQQVLTVACRAELTNDHKSVTKQIDRLIQELHAATKQSSIPDSQVSAHAETSAGRTSRQSTAGAPQTSGGTPKQTSQYSRPVAMVDGVSEASPASRAGIQVCLCYLPTFMCLLDCYQPTCCRFKCHHLLCRLGTCLSV